MNRVLPEGSVIGSRDAGVIGYFSRFPVVNLGRSGELVRVLPGAQAPARR